MKKQKLKLEDIKVDSFITTTKEEAKTVKGGDITDFLSLAPGTIYIDITNATEGIHRITATVVKSNRDMDCAGATRRLTGCTNGTFPCDNGCI